MRKLQKALKILLTMVMVISLSTQVGAVSLEDTAEQLEIGDTRTIYLGKSGLNDFKFHADSAGVLKISLSTLGRATCVKLFDANGKSVRSVITREAKTGKWSILGSNPTSNPLYALCWNENVEKSNGYVKYKIPKGDYYIRIYGHYYYDTETYGKKCTFQTSFESTDSKAATAAAFSIQVKKDTSIQLGTVLTPSDSTSKVEWKSSKPEIATVSAKGKVTAVSKGNSTITATVNGIKLKILVKVYE